MTAREIETAKALGACTYLPGTAHKRFARDIALFANLYPYRELTDRRRAYMQIMAWRYRRQMPPGLVPAAKPDDLPPKPPRPASGAKAAPPASDLFEGEQQADLSS